MIKKTLLFSLFCVSTILLSAQSTSESLSKDNNLAILITLGVAVAALIISVINSFRISHNRRISDVELVNQKDDLNVTMEAVKDRLSRDLRGMRRELGKNTKPNKPVHKNQNQNKNQEENSDTTTENTAEKKPSDRKPYKRRNSNYKRRPSNKKDNETKPEEAK